MREGKTTESLWFHHNYSAPLLLLSRLAYHKISVITTKTGQKDRHYLLVSVTAKTDKEMRLSGRRIRGTKEARSVDVCPPLNPWISAQCCDVAAHVRTKM